MPKGVYDVCLGARCFHSLYLRLVRIFHSQMEVQYVWGAWFMYKEILSDHCPCANYEWWRGLGVLPPEKIDFNEAKSCNFRKFETKHSLLKESIDSLFL